MANPEEVGGEELEPPKEDPCTRPVGFGNGENKFEHLENVRCRGRSVSSDLGSRI